MTDYTDAMLDQLEAEMSGAGAEAPAPEDVREKYKVQDLAQASRYMRAIARLQKRQEENAAAMQAEVDRVTGFYKTENEDLQGRINFFTELVLEYDDARRAEDPKFRLKTPNGQVNKRTSKGYSWTDEAALIDWLTERRPDLVRTETVQKIEKTAFKKAMGAADELGNVVDPETGEIVPGVHTYTNISHTVKVEEAGQ
jgi:phage host-nuclease inhibitor protein Gam